ncbi:YybH family protein [Streptomyces nigra]|uniref:YybH family protein n=1 Tax=Streptomyces nigra TaxID=1827580 RepID=UPI0038119D76
MPSTTDDETVLHDVLERWRTAVDAHRPQDVAAVFTEDAIFQGLHPYGVGRDAVAAYYASQPLGMRAAYRILETRRFADDLVLGYLDVEFTFTDRDPVAVKLAVLARRQDGGWYLAHYQVSRLAQ